MGQLPRTTRRRALKNRLAVPGPHPDLLPGEFEPAQQANAFVDKRIPAPVLVVLAQKMKFGVGRNRLCMCF